MGASFSVSWLVEKLRRAEDNLAHKNLFRRAVICLTAKRYYAVAPKRTDTNFDTPGSCSDSCPYSDVRRPSKIRWPPAGGMKDAQNLQAITAHPIGNNVRCTRDHQFPSTRHSSGPSARRKIPQPLHGLDDQGCNAGRCHRVIPRDVLPFGIQSCQCRAQPFNPHGASTS